MALERKTTALEFETMLRRHLRRGGAPVSACAGFDPDRASAYLEGALGGNARGRYEAHLAGCPACRRHVIELSRLSQLALQPEAMPVLPAGWLQWKSSLAESIDRWVYPSAWRLNWRVAGTVLAGCAILAFAMITRPWRQSSPLNSSESIAKSSQEIDARAAAQASSITSQYENKVAIPAEEDRLAAQSRPLGLSVRDSSAENRIADQAPSTTSTIDRAGQTIPEPRVAIASNNINNNIASNLRDRAEPQFAAAASVEPASPPSTTATKRAPQEADNEFIHTTHPTQRMTSGPGAEIIAENRIKTRADRLPLPLVIPRMTPNPQYNPMQSGPLRERGMPKDKSEKGLPQNQNQRNAIAAIFKEYMKYMKGYVPFLGDGNFERSLVIGKSAVKDDDSENDENKAAREQTDFNKSNKLVRHLRGKTFRFVRGVWIDDQYDAEMSAWRLTWLKRGSEAYNRVLAEKPQLREFFDFGPIIIVWQDKIYRITEN